MEASYRERLALKEFDLNDTDDMIEEYIRKHQDTVANVSIQKIAADLYVAPNAVMRFAKKLGYSGFSELKFAIAREHDADSKDIAAAGEKTLTSQMFANLPNSIIRTVDAIDPVMVAKAASVIAQSETCILAGLGDSLRGCEVLRNGLRCYHEHVEYNTHIHDIEYTVNHGSAEDVLIIISARGTNQRLVDLCDNASRRGMNTISLTHCYTNPLASHARYQLYFYAPHEELNESDITDRCGQMILLRVLCEKFWKLHEMK